MDNIDSLHAQVRALTGLNGTLLRLLVSRGVLTPADAADVISSAGRITAVTHPDAQKLLKDVLGIADRGRPPGAS